MDRIFHSFSKFSRWFSPVFPVFFEFYRISLKFTSRFTSPQFSRIFLFLDSSMDCKLREVVYFWIRVDFFMIFWHDWLFRWSDQKKNVPFFVFFKVFWFLKEFSGVLSSLLRSVFPFYEFEFPSTFIEIAEIFLILFSRFRNLDVSLVYSLALS